eukprot:scaffold112697_cov45-Phaeocystis_antarctica.AAC.1
MAALGLPLPAGSRAALRLTVGGHRLRCCAHPHLVDHLLGRGLALVVIQHRERSHHVLHHLLLIAVPQHDGVLLRASHRAPLGPCRGRGAVAAPEPSTARLVVRGRRLCVRLRRRGSQKLRGRRRAGGCGGTGKAEHGLHAEGAGLGGEELLEHPPGKG